MKNTNHNPPKKDNFVTVSLALLFTSLVLLCGYLVIKLSTQKLEPSNPIVTVGVSPTPSLWEVYTNSEFGVSFEVPRLLLKQDIRNSDGYLYILYFGENVYSEGRGVGFAVSETNLDQEVSDTKAEYGKDESAKLEKETEIEVGGEKGKLLSYRPNGEDENLEERDVLFIHHGKYTFTISTTPQQMEQVIQSFKFL